MSNTKCRRIAAAWRPAVVSVGLILAGTQAFGAGSDCKVYQVSPLTCADYLQARLAENAARTAAKKPETDQFYSRDMPVHAFYVYGIISGANLAQAGVVNTLPYDHPTILTLVEAACRSNPGLSETQAVWRVIQEHQTEWVRH